MTTPYFNFLKRAIFVMAPFVFIACEKPNKQLGLDLVDSGTDFEDTALSVISHTVNVDSLAVAFSYSNQVALGGYSGNRLAGAYVDPDFGRAEAAIVSQMILSTVNIDFGSNPVVDSVNLFLNYAGYYGDTTQPMDLEVYELTESLARDKMYFSDFEPSTGEKIGGKSNFLPRPNTGVTINGNPTGATLKIPLDEDYFRRTFAEVGNGSFAPFSSNEEFVDYFKGLVVKPAGEGSILYFNLNSGNSRLVIYYHNDAQSNQVVNLDFSQSGNTKPIHFSIFDQDYGNYPTAFDLDDQDTVDGESTTYVQAMGGVAAALQIEGLQTLAADGLLVNKALLRVPKQSGGSEYLEPPRLEIRELTDNGPGSAIEDFSLGNNASESNGLLDDEQEYYEFDISRYVFNVLNGAEERELVIVPVAKSTVANRVILEGGSHNDGPLELKIYYTKI